eukprot:3303567-Pyramimonas_sp.AAC.1
MNSSGATTSPSGRKLTAGAADSRGLPNRRRRSAAAVNSWRSSGPCGGGRSSGPPSMRGATSRASR